MLAESAYYRFVFWQGMREPPSVPLRTQHTLFGARLRARRGYALQLPPFATFREVLASRDDYGPTQQLGRALRDAGADAVEYVSARDVEGGLNVALYTPDGVRVSHGRRSSRNGCARRGPTKSAFTREAMLVCAPFRCRSSRSTDRLPAPAA